MLERAGMSDRIKSVMGLIRRYESLFQLPSRIVQETEQGEFETVGSSRHNGYWQTLHQMLALLHHAGFCFACQLTPVQCRLYEATLPNFCHLRQLLPVDVTQFIVHSESITACLQYFLACRW